MLMALDPRAEVVRGLLEETGKSIRWLARQIGINHTSVSKYVAGETDPRDDDVWEQMTIALRGAQAARGLPPMPVKTTKLVKIPVVGKAAAGEGTHNVDSDDFGIYVPANLAGPDHLGWVVDGDSMMPALEDGDVAVFRPASTPRSRLAFLVKSKDGFRVKKMGWNSSDNRWEMQSINRNYPDEPLGDSQLIGFLVGFYRARGSYEKIEVDIHGLEI